MHLLQLISNAGRAADKSLINFCVRARCQGGQTLAEYAIVLTVIALIVVAVAIFFGSSVSTLFSSSARHL